MEAQITWQELGSALGIVALVIGTLFGIWWRIEGRISRAAESASTKASAAHARADLTAAHLAEYKTHVAETYVSKAGHRESTEQIMGAINGVKASVDGTNQRIDTLFSGPPKRRTAPKHEG